MLKKRVFYELANVTITSNVLYYYKMSNKYLNEDKQNYYKIFAFQ